MSFDLLARTAYIANKVVFSYFAAIFDAILDFSACHQLFKVMPAVPETTDIVKHFDR